MVKDVLANLVLAALMGAAIWAASPSLTGRTEPWDSESLYYVASLAIAGVLLGLSRPRRVWIHPVGIVLGQLLYELLFLPIGPFLGVGVLFLVAYSLLSLVGALLGKWLRLTLEGKSRGTSSSA